MRDAKPLVVLEPASGRPDAGGVCLSGMFLAYIQDSNRASVEKTRVRENARVAVEAEQERTERHRIHADKVIAGQRQETERVRLRADADVRIAKERRRAFESLVEGIKHAVRSGEITLNAIRGQFQEICGLLGASNLPPEDRGRLLGLLEDLMGQQRAAVSQNGQAILGFQRDALPPREAP